MYQLIETICFENGLFQRLHLHEARMNRSRQQLGGYTDKLSLTGRLIPPTSPEGHKFKCRIIYGKSIESIEYEPYTLKGINSLKLIADDSIDYTHKFKDRSVLNRLLEQRGEADEMLVVKNGLLTDTSFSNVVFLKNGNWYTPATPLLPGTRREDYLQKGAITPCNIRAEELSLYKEARLINAMRSLEEAESIPICNISW